MTNFQTQSRPYMAYNLICRCSIESVTPHCSPVASVYLSVFVCVSFSLYLCLSLCLTLPPTPHGFSCYATRVCSYVCVCVHAPRPKTHSTTKYLHISQRFCLALFVQPVATVPTIQGTPPRPCFKPVNYVSIRVLTSVTQRVIECPVRVVSASWLPLPFFVCCQGTHPLLACSAVHCATVGSFVMAHTPTNTHMLKHTCCGPYLNDFELTRQV